MLYGDLIGHWEKRNIKAMRANLDPAKLDRGAIAELIEEYGGDLFPIGDIAALAAILRRHASAPRQRLARDLTPHFIENVNRTIVEVYDKLIARRGQYLVKHGSMAANI